MSSAIVVPLVAFACLIGATGCTGGSDRSGAGSGRATPSTSRSSEHVSPANPSRPPSRVVEPEQACGGDPFKAKNVRPYNPDADDYAGREVHPTLLVYLHQYEDPYVPTLPQEWKAWNPAETQLVVCAHRDETFRDRFVETCTYSDRSKAELRSARYVYRVYEAATGRLVRRFTLRGTLNGCPHSVSGGAGAFPYYEYVDSADLRRALRPLVTGLAR